MPGNPAVLLNQVLAYSKLQEWDDALGVLEDMKMIVKREEAEGVEMASRYTSNALEKLEKSILKNRDRGWEDEIEEEANNEEGIIEEGIQEQGIQEQGIQEQGIQEQGINEEENRTVGLMNPVKLAGVGLMATKEMRGEVETKYLPKNTSLKRGMKNMPVEWVRFACKQHNLPVDGLREDMETALEEALVLSESGESAEVLNKALDALDPAEKEVLQYLLKKGGTAGTSYLVRTYGSMEEDGYFWEEGDIPNSTLGRLWSKCLIMVGKGLVNGKRQKVALIPTDLLAHIEKHF